MSSIFFYSVAIHNRMQCRNHYKRLLIGKTVEKQTTTENDIHTHTHTLEISGPLSSYIRTIQRLIACRHFYNDNWHFPFLRKNHGIHDLFSILFNHRLVYTHLSVHNTPIVSMFCRVEMASFFGEKKM